MTSSSRSLAHLLRPVRPLVVGALLAEGLATIALLLPLLAAVDAVSDLVDGRSPSLDGVLLALAGGLTHVVAHGGASWLLHVADNRLQLDLRRRALAVYSCRPLARLDQEGSTGVKSAAGDDVDALHHLVGHALADATASLTLLVAGCMLMLQASPLLTLLALSPALLAILLQRHQSRRSAEQMRRYTAASAALDAAAVELARSAASLRAFDTPTHRIPLDALAESTRETTTGPLRRRFQSAAQEWSDFVRSWAGEVTRSMTAQQALLSGAGVTLVLAVAGGVGWISGPDAVPHLVLVLTLTPIVTSPLWSLAFAAQDLAVGGAAAQRLATMLEQSVARPSTATEATTEATWDGTSAPRVDVDDLSVVRGDRVILDGVTFSAPAGAITVILGHSGAGKSSVLECLAGLAPADTGSIRIGGGTPPTGTAWTTHVAGVSQAPIAVRATLLENVRLGRPDLNEATCRAALRAAGLGDQVDGLREGMATVLGEGVAFSGGERQRLALARALAASPRVLFLDEPTSWVDAATAADLDACLAGLRGRCTVIRVDHRRQVAATADHVVVLDNGRVVAEGAPEAVAR